MFFYKLKRDVPCTNSYLRCKTYGDVKARSDLEAEDTLKAQTFLSDTHHTKYK